MFKYACECATENLRAVGYISRTLQKSIFLSWLYDIGVIGAAELGTTDILTRFLRSPAAYSQR